VQGEEKLNLVTFGLTNPKVPVSKKTAFNLKMKNSHFMKITANIVPVICNNLERKPLKALMEPDVALILQSVDLADTLPTKNERSPIGVLIGNDFYLDIILGKKFELSQGLYLMWSQCWFYLLSEN